MKASFSLYNVSSFNHIGCESRRRQRVADMLPNVVGPVFGADGTTPATGRQSKTGETTVAQAHGKYYEPASRGVLFAGGDNGVGYTPQLAASTLPNMALINPANSGKRLAIKKVSISYFSGTLPSGSFYHGFATGATGAGPSSQNQTDIGNGGAIAAVAKCLYGLTSGTTGTVLYPLASSFAELATTTNGLQTAIEDVDGAIVVEPGNQYQLMSVCGTTGSSPKISSAIVWEEIPIVASQG